MQDVRLPRTTCGAEPIEANRVRVRITRGFLTSRLGLALLGACCVFLLSAAGFVVYRWISYGHMIDERLAGHAQQTTARIYAAPTRISDGEMLSASQLVS